ncbi:hypothetical protein AB6A40_001701 [Gnathostoma spinigerum]|uniref:Uncharacterized protein n=1 Tax=Gnathostoma spinigerum TaxID=75299 RepID=A0ABD6EEP2_9BILA
MADPEKQPEDVSSDSDIEHDEYEKQRELHAKRLLWLEKRFAETKTRIRQERLKQLAARQSQILHQTAPDYLARRASFLKEHAARVKRNKALHDLQMEALRRKMVGTLEVSQKNLVNNKKLVLEKLESRLLAEIEEVKKDFAKKKSELDDYECPYSPTRFARDPEYDAMKREVENAIGPLIIYGAHKDEIMSDLKLIDRAVRWAENRVDYLNTRYE